MQSQEQIDWRQRGWHYGMTGAGVYPTRDVCSASEETLFIEGFHQARAEKAALAALNNGNYDPTRDEEPDGRGNWGMD